MKFKHFFVKPTPLEVFSDQLNEAQVQLLEMQYKAEYYNAMVKMAEGRVTRLENTNPELVARWRSGVFPGEYDELPGQVTHHQPDKL